MVTFRFCAFLPLLAFVTSFRYSGYKIYEANANTIKQLDFLYKTSHQQGFDGLLIPRNLNQSSVIMVAPREQSYFEQQLDSLSIPYKITVDDVAKKLQNDGIEKQAARGRARRIGFNQYYRLADINGYLDELEQRYPRNVFVKRVGSSYERRAIKTIRITNGDGRAGKKVIFVDAGIHAREWIAPATALYIINRLVEDMDNNRNLLNDFDWLILPVVNPDGYEYTHTRNRMWRKTRSRSSGQCIGTDANRNFAFHWGETGASSDPCSETYRGSRTFSEAETQIVRDILLSLKGFGKFYLTLHSYGNYLLYPWGWTSDLPETYRDLDEVALAGAKAIRSATGTNYTHGSSTRVLYAAAGGSDDYAFAEAEFPISITMELPAGGSGFDPKPAQIKGFVEEAWVGIKAMALKVFEKY